MLASHWSFIVIHTNYKNILIDYMHVCWKQQRKHKLMENRRSKTKGQLYWMDEDIGYQEFDAYISGRICTSVMKRREVNYPGRCSDCQVSVVLWCLLLCRRNKCNSPVDSQLPLPKEYYQRISSCFKIRLQIL